MPQIHKHLEDYISNIQLPEQPSNLYQPIRYILEDGGKRMRPCLAILAHNLYREAGEEIYSAAIALEVFHNFTLLHDDIMDGAALRRGRETVHIKWSANTAILSGDAMLILAYRLLGEGVSGEKLPRVLEIFNKASMEVCQGQQYDMDFENQSAVSLDQYLKMIHLKTAVLMAASLEIGAYIGGASKEQCQALYDFGINIGLAFQIQDDLLDTYGDQSSFGKSIGGDIAVGKKTFLYLTAYQNASAEQKTVLEKSRDLQTVRDIYDLMGVREQAQKTVEDYFAKAMENLTRAQGETTGYEKLKLYADELLKRQR